MDADQDFAVRMRRFVAHRPGDPERYRATGAWRDVPFAEMLAAEIARDPGRIAVIDGERALTIVELERAGRRLAGWMRRQGIRMGDVVSSQLPNWWEAFVVDVAIGLLGAVAAPIVPIYRDAEVGFILKESRAKLFFAPESFRNFRYDEMAARLKPNLPDLVGFVPVRPAAGPSFDEFLDSAEPIADTPAIDPDWPRLLLFTSGTTGRAKGVIHSTNTLDCEIRTTAEAWTIRRGDKILMPSPLTHATGYLYGILVSETHGRTTILMDSWDADRAVALIERHRIDAMVAATPFLIELAAAARRAGTALPSLRVFSCGGAPMAPETMRAATETFAQAAVFRAYGSSEAPTVTAGPAERGTRAAIETDGHVVHQVKLVDADGKPVPVGKDGEILTRSPELMLGYLRDEDNEAFDEEGYFRTGDIGRLDAEGMITITGRKKDLIIRGGENIAPREIEDLLHAHDAVAEAAVVGMPHARLGETVCAFLLLKPGREATAEEILKFLADSRIARQKLPERIEFRTTLPKTPAGKIQKFVLRDEIAALVKGE